MKNILFILLFISVNVSMAQDTIITEKDTIITNTGKIEVDQVEVIKAFEAKLSDAKKISVSPKVRPVIATEKTYDYDITIVPVEISYPDPVIKPLAMNPDPAKNVDRFYTRLGYGDLKSPYGDASYQYVRGDEYDFIINAHYYGADDSEEIANRKFYESDLNVSGGYRIGENNKLNLDLNASKDFRNLYDTLFARTATDIENIQRDILDINTKISFQNIETTSGGFDYAGYIHGGRIQMEDRLEAWEMRYGAGFNTQKHFSDRFSIILDADASFYELSFSTNDPGMQRLFTIKPGFRFGVGAVTIKALADIFIDNNGTSPFVEAEANVSLMDNSLQIFIGADQKVQANSLFNKYNDNPFASPLVIEPRNTIAKQYYGGVRGKLKDILTFSVSAGYEDIKDQRFDRNNLGALLRQSFDDMTNVFVNANIEFKVNKYFTVGGIVNQNFFDPETLENVINMASYTYNTYAKLSILGDKLTIRADLDLADQIFWRQPVTEELISGNKQLDLSLGVDYYVTSNFGLWLRGNNLLDREYLMYHYYPGIGRNLLGGLLVKF